MLVVYFFNYYLIVSLSVPPPGSTTMSFIPLMSFTDPPLFLPSAARPCQTTLPLSRRLTTATPVSLLPLLLIQHRLTSASVAAKAVRRVRHPSPGMAIYHSNRVCACSV